LDRYYQIVKCFRDEELRADRQPEFTQIDCEMSFVDQHDIIETFEPLICHLFKESIGVELPVFPHMTYADAMKYYGVDKPDTRFDMRFVELTDIVKGKGFNVFDKAECVLGICAPGMAEASKKKNYRAYALSNIHRNWCSRTRLGKIPQRGRFEVWS